MRVRGDEQREPESGGGLEWCMDSWTVDVLPGLEFEGMKPMTLTRDRCADETGLTAANRREKTSRLELAVGRPASTEGVEKMKMEVRESLWL